MTCCWVLFLKLQSRVFSIFTVCKQSATVVCKMNIVFSLDRLEASKRDKQGSRPLLAIRKNMLKFPTCLEEVWGSVQIRSCVVLKNMAAAKMLKSSLQSRTWTNQRLHGGCVHLLYTVYVCRAGFVLVTLVCVFCACRWSLNGIRERNSYPFWTRPSSWYRTTSTWASWSKSSGKQSCTSISTAGY